jgi:hypothetical protein
VTQAYAAARALLSGAAERLGLDCPEQIPLRLDGKQGVLLSALPRLLAAACGEQADALAGRLSGAVSLSGSPFSAVEHCRGMVLLTLSDQWCREVLERFQVWPQLPPPPSGVRAQNENEPLFLLGYTARRCRFLAAAQEECKTLPRALICLLAQEHPDGIEVCRGYWRLSPPLRRQSLLAKAVGICAAEALGQL